MFDRLGFLYVGSSIPVYHTVTYNLTMDPPTGHRDWFLSVGQCSNDHFVDVSKSPSNYIVLCIVDSNSRTTAHMVPDAHRRMM